MKIMKLHTYQTSKNQASFGNSSLPRQLGINTLVNQSIKQNLGAIEAEARENVSQEITDKFLPQFRKEIEDSKNDVSSKDIHNIFGHIALAMNQAGREQEAQAFLNYKKN